MNTALMLMAVNSYLIHYVQKLGCTSLLLFLSVCSNFLFFRIIKSKDGWTELLVAIGQPTARLHSYVRMVGCPCTMVYCRRTLQGSNVDFFQDV